MPEPGELDRLKRTIRLAYNDLGEIESSSIGYREREIIERTRQLLWRSLVVPPTSAACPGCGLPLVVRAAEIMLPVRHQGDWTWSVRCPNDCTKYIQPEDVGRQQRQEAEACPE